MAKLWRHVRLEPDAYEALREYKDEHELFSYSASVRQAIMKANELENIDNK